MQMDEGEHERKIDIAGAIKTLKAIAPEIRRVTRMQHSALPRATRMLHIDTVQRKISQLVEKFSSGKYKESRSCAAVVNLLQNAIVQDAILGTDPERVIKIRLGDLVFVIEDGQELPVRTRVEFQPVFGLAKELWSSTSKTSNWARFCVVNLNLQEKSAHILKLALASISEEFQ